MTDSQFDIKQALDQERGGGSTPGYLGSGRGIASGGPDTEFDLQLDPEVDSGLEPYYETTVEDVDESNAIPLSSAPVCYFRTQFDVHGLVRRFTQNATVVPSFDPSEQLQDPNATGFQRAARMRT